MPSPLKKSTSGSGTGSGTPGAGVAAGPEPKPKPELGLCAIAGFADAVRSARAEGEKHAANTQEGRMRRIRVQQGQVSMPSVLPVHSAKPYRNKHARPPRDQILAVPAR